VAGHRLRVERDPCDRLQLRGEVEDGRFKTASGERDVPLFKSIRGLLLERKAKQLYKRPEDFVFGTSVGTPMDPNNFVKREFCAAIKAVSEVRTRGQSRR
jgi:hypothetical protein